MERMFLPSLYVRGTHYQIGYDVGKTFKSMIEEYVNKCSFLIESLLPAYDTDRGRSIYEDSLELIKKRFPYYVKEVEGMSDGSQVPFHLLMLLNMDGLILEVNDGANQSGKGCTSILCNQQDVVLGHTEDYPRDTRHLCYIIHADITDTDSDGKLNREKFSSFCYAGTLPGFCMNVNRHGLVFTMNVIDTIGIRPNKTPRNFLTRALLSVSNLEEAMLILRDSGSGTSHGFNVNMAFINQGDDVPLVFHTVEVGPVKEAESQLSLLTISPGEAHVRCNRFMRLELDEVKTGVDYLSSAARHEVMDRIGLPRTIYDVINILSNDDDPDYPIYRRGTEKDEDVTLATGIFDFKSKEWRIYVDRAQTSDPIAIFPLQI